MSADFTPKSDFLRILTERGYIHQASDMAGIDAAARQIITGFPRCPCPPSP